LTDIHFSIKLTQLNKNKLWWKFYPYDFELDSPTWLINWSLVIWGLDRIWV